MPVNITVPEGIFADALRGKLGSVVVSAALLQDIAGFIQRGARVFVADDSDKRVRLGFQDGFFIVSDP